MSYEKKFSGGCDLMIDKETGAVLVASSSPLTAVPSDFTGGAGGDPGVGGKTLADLESDLAALLVELRLMSIESRRFAGPIDVTSTRLGTRKLSVTGL